MPELEVTRIQYGPNPFSIQQGGLFSFEFSVLFTNGTPPDTFTYNIYVSLSYDDHPEQAA